MFFEKDIEPKLNISIPNYGEVKYQFFAKNEVVYLSRKPIYNLVENYEVNFDGIYNYTILGSGIHVVEPHPIYFVKIKINNKERMEHVLTNLLFVLTLDGLEENVDNLPIGFNYNDVFISKRKSRLNEEQRKVVDDTLNNIQIADMMNTKNGTSCNSSILGSVTNFFKKLGSIEGVPSSSYSSDECGNRSSSSCSSYTSSSSSYSSSGSSGSCSSFND